METIIVFKRRHFPNSSHFHKGQAHYQLVEKPPAQLGALHPKGFSNENIHHCIYGKKKKKHPTSDRFIKIAFPQCLSQQMRIKAMC